MPIPKTCRIPEKQLPDIVGVELCRRTNRFWAVLAELNQAAAQMGGIVVRLFIEKCAP